MSPQNGTIITREMADQIDLADTLPGLRRRFIIDDDDALYMDGNSLGRQPTGTAALVAHALDAWRKDLIIAWREWIHVPRKLGDLSRISAGGALRRGHRRRLNLGESLQGRGRSDARAPGQTTLVTSDDNFPTDLYVLQSLAAQHVLEPEGASRRPVNGLDASVLARPR